MTDETNRDDEEPRGEEPWSDPDDGGADGREEPRAGRFEEERWLRRLDVVLQRHEFPTQRSFDRFLESDRHEKEAEELEDALTIEEEAQELAYLSMEAPDDEAAENYARDAIALDPDCVDARVMLAYFVTDDLDERIWLLERAVDCARWRFESTKTGDRRDHYFPRIEAKPLQRALHALAEATIEGGNEDDAEKLFEESIALPGDGDARCLYAVFLLRFGRLEKARAHLEALDADDVARDWCEALERFLAGARDEAEVLLAAARPKNFWVAGYLTGEHAAPKDAAADALTEEQDDALWIASTLRPAWEAHPEALEWLRGHS